jgi:N-acetylglucosamine-6-phosphate deacetylase
MELRGHILTPQGFVRGSLKVDTQGRIGAIRGEAVDESAVPADGAWLLPGFVDAHVHGGGGFDVMEGAEAAQAVARLHARHGTTTLLATTMTAPLPVIETALKALAPLCGRRLPGAAAIAGVHLEGPYINPERLGAQPDTALPATLAPLRALLALAPVRLLTLAPEMPGHLALVAALSAEGLRVQIGHSNGSYDDGVAALRQGASGFTHLFNAMSPLHHREPGMVGAALAHATHAEIIPDLLHVHPGAIHAALRAIPCLYCVSDSTAGAGMPDGPYRLGDTAVVKCQGSVRTPEGRLAGSALTMDQALRNLVALGLTLRQASARVSTIAADYLGLHDRGRLVAGARADLVVLDASLTLKQVLVEGEQLELTDA